MKENKCPYKNNGCSYEYCPFENPLKCEHWRQLAMYNQNKLEYLENENKEVHIVAR